jgi:hypothetical protein
MKKMIWMEYEENWEHRVHQVQKMEDDRRKKEEQEMEKYKEIWEHVLQKREDVGHIVRRVNKGCTLTEIGSQTSCATFQCSVKSCNFSIYFVKNKQGKKKFTSSFTIPKKPQKHMVWLHNHQPRKNPNPRKRHDRQDNRQAPKKQKQHATRRTQTVVMDQKYASSSGETNVEQKETGRYRSP